jgi:ParG
MTLLGNPFFEDGVPRPIDRIPNSQQQPQAPAGRMKRFSVDVSHDLHRRIKVGCANEGADMATLIRVLLENRFPPSR